MGGTFEVKIFMVCGAEHFYFILSRDIKGKPEQILEETQYSKNKSILKRTPNHLGNPWHAGDMEDNTKTKKGGFPGGSAEKSPLAKAGDTGSILDPGRSTCRHRAVKPICRNYGTRALGPVSRSCGSRPVLEPRPRGSQTPACTRGRAHTQEGQHGQKEVQS